MHACKLTLVSITALVLSAAVTPSWLPPKFTKVALEATL
jgi:hypothetical protein